MQVSEALIMDLSNAQRDIGMLYERIAWLQWAIGECENSPRELELLRKRLEMAGMDLTAASERLRKIYKELYGD